jgi:hypothetical protein
VIINILGTDYEVVIKDYAEEELFKRLCVSGFCDVYKKQLLICNPASFPGWEHADLNTLDIERRETIRHEIIHAFLNESGLSSASAKDTGWAANEEMIDWIAIQGPKIYAAWRAAGAI